MGGRRVLIFALVGSGIAQAQPPPDASVEPEPAKEPTREPIPPVERRPAVEPAAAKPPSEVATSEPIGIEEPPAPAREYPVSLAARALLLPVGVGEGSVAIRHQRSGSSLVSDSAFTTTNVEPRLRFSGGPLEVEGAAGLLVHHSEPDLGGPIVFAEPEKLSFLYAAVRYALTRDLAVGGTLLMRTPTAEGTRLAPRAIIRNKQHLAPGAAIVFGLGAGLDHVSSETTDQQSAVIEGELAVQAQVAPQLALEARAALRYINPNDEPRMPGSFEAFLAQDYGLRVVIGVAPALDIVAAFDVLASGEGDVRLYTLGVAARRLP